jgi:hypothetical protein
LQELLLSLKLQPWSFRLNSFHAIFSADLLASLALTRGERAGFRIAVGVTALGLSTLGAGAPIFSV